MSADTSTTQATSRRDALVRAAFEVIAERGFEGLRTREVAARVGVNVATLHYHLPSKDDLVAAVARHLAERYRDEHAPPVAPAAAAALTRLRQEFADAQHYRSACPDLMRVFRELALRAERDPTVEAVLSPLYRYWSDALTDMLEDGVRDGSLRGDLDPRAGATVLVAFLWGGGSLPLLDVGAFAAACREMERWVTGGSP